MQNSQFPRADGRFHGEPRDKPYFRAREAQERTAAEQARDERARAAHEELAERYHDLAGDPDEPKPDQPAQHDPARAA